VTTEARVLKTGGYLISTLSVILLGIVAWKGASEHPLLLACLIGGMVSSAAGMCLRWLSYRHERRHTRGVIEQLGPKPRMSPAWMSG
jgi:hypothetical protein